MTTQKPLVFYLEDNQAIADLIELNLQVKGFNYQRFVQGQDLLSALQNVSESPDIFLLDLMLPDMGGLEVCEKIKSQIQWSKTPIIIISAKGEEEDIVKGLEIGADDYITKPFSPKLLMARINAVLRRFISDSEGLINDELIVSSGLSVNFKRVEVLVDEKPIVLTATEFKILSFLIRSPGSVFTRSQIVKAVHGENYAVTDRTIDFQMVGLRKKLLNYGDKIETIRGIGYRFKDS